ncbi:rCG50247 [Rattus norvegicus]|uniref:RCG50247 n=1 Tax=Rattus norvegicus TaxID=10116 RepID=A6JZ75_RAT|nr:rCG50247 [Rattus norvegicus]
MTVGFQYMCESFTCSFVWNLALMMVVNCHVSAGAF